MKRKGKFIYALGALALAGAGGWTVFHHTELGATMYDFALCVSSGNQEGLWKHRERVARAESGDAWAASYLGYRYATGRCVSQNHERAVYYFTQAAEAGDANAMLNLYHSYSRGEGVAYDEHKAQDWLLRAAQNGESDAQYRVGALFARGKGGFAQDGEKTLEWMSQSAAQDHYGALFSLGYLRRNGELGGGALIYPQAVDYGEALKWLSAAAAQGNAYAMAELAEMFNNGEGVPADKAQAREWIERALALARKGKQFDAEFLLARKREMGFL